MNAPYGSAPILDFTGKVAIVTGAGSGIGAATAARLGSAGARTWLVDRSLVAAQQQAAAIPGAVAVELDIADSDGWAALVDRVIAEAGRLDVLVNAAGITRTDGPTALLDLDIESWRRIFAVNVEGTLHGCRSAIRVMKPGGAIVNVGSVIVEVASSDLAAYGASKAAVGHLTKSVAVGCGKAGLGIRCNAVLPGMIDTAMTAGIPAEARAAWVTQIASGRLGDAADVADAIIFLASDAARYVNGAAFAVDGGLSLRSY